MMRPLGTHVGDDIIAFALELAMPHTRCWRPLGGCGPMLT